MIKGFTFGWDARKGDFKKSTSRLSLETMLKETNADTIIIAMAALQDTPQSTNIDFNGPHMVEDDELIDMIQFGKSLGAKVYLKPTINVRNGTWRAHINFFDVDVPCEPKWSEWFESYTNYQKHYALIAEETGCEMLIVGCEMVQSERREREWRSLIAQVREVYSGKITYNTDKYQEDKVKWWDAVDVISSSGYYPINDWPNQLKRIESVVKKYDKPFFFVEAGCMSRTGSSMIPNNWEYGWELNLDEQAMYYQIMFEECGKMPFVEGFGLWDWATNLYELEAGKSDKGYGVYGKPASKIINQFYAKM